MTEIPTESYPLTWPSSQPRTPRDARRRARFRSDWRSSLKHVIAEVGRLGGSGIVVSTNLRPRLDGLPYADDKQPEDTGVAVWFTRKRKPTVIACDTYATVRDNLHAIGLVIESLRAIERHGSPSLLEQAFQGFAALPAHAAEPSWWDVLGVRPDATVDEICRAHQALAIKHHPDGGGDHETMARINRARDIALEERGA